MNDQSQNNLRLLHEAEWDALDREISTQYHRMMVRGRQPASILLGTREMQVFVRAMRERSFVDAAYTLDSPYGIPVQYHGMAVIPTGRDSGVEVSPLSANEWMRAQHEERRHREAITRSPWRREFLPWELRVIEGEVRGLWSRTNAGFPSFP